MRIIRFEAEHIKKIQVVQITPRGHVVEISGKNGAGKTSILDSIWWALAGDAEPPARPPSSTVTTRGGSNSTWV